MNIGAIERMSRQERGRCCRREVQRNGERRPEKYEAAPSARVCRLASRRLSARNVQTPSFRPVQNPSCVRCSQLWMRSSPQRALPHTKDSESQDLTCASRFFFVPTGNGKYAVNFRASFCGSHLTSASFTFKGYSASKHNQRQTSSQDCMSRPPKKWVNCQLDLPTDRPRPVTLRDARAAFCDLP
jgi:hypothetical protein